MIPSPTCREKQLKKIFKHRTRLFFCLVRISLELQKRRNCSLVIRGEQLFSISLIVLFVSFIFKVCRTTAGPYSTFCFLCFCYLCFGHSAVFCLYFELHFLFFFFSFCFIHNQIPLFFVLCMISCIKKISDNQSYGLAKDKSLYKFCCLIKKSFLPAPIVNDKHRKKEDTYEKIHYRKEPVRFL